MKSALFLLSVALLASLSLGGCVDRWMLVTSEPPGARIFLDSIEVARTPARIPFDHYGTREVLLRLDPPAPEARTGDWVEYESARQLVELETPWYEWFPIDLLSEHLWPGRLVDEHRVHVILRPFVEASARARLDEERRRYTEEMAPAEKPPRP